ncbi:MAG: aldehyde dehydrogenase family protein [Nitrososphaerota archaeon]|nr:aldehyde dehydrogenase family protein [Nitrososphaerota archaeon]
MIDYQSLGNEVLGNGSEIEDKDPATGSVIAKVKTMSEEDVEAAIRRAAEAFATWSRTNPVKRGQILTRAGEIMESEVEELALLMTMEEGKTLSDSRLEVTRSFNTLKFYGSVALRHGGSTIPSGTNATTILTFKEPLGLVALITPWNFPLSIPVWKTAPALAAGNSIVLKPASKTPLIVLEFMRILNRAGLPRDVANVITGTGSKLGDLLVSDKRIAAVSFTGSVPVGNHIHSLLGKKENTTRIQLELGGKNAVYVDNSAKVDQAADIAVRGAFGLTGQSCTATSRLIVHESIYQQLKDAILIKMNSWKVGPGTEDDVNMGPVVDGNQLNTDLEYIELGKKEGLRPMYGGGIEGSNSLFLKPTIFEDVSPESRLFKEEIFGPVLSVIRAKNEDEAIELVNSVSFGHTSAIVTENLPTAMKFVNSVDTGVVKVNRPTVGVELQAPFGAFKKSGANTWKEMGEEAMAFYTREKTVYLGW